MRLHALALVLGAPSFLRAANISNTVPRRDAAGRLMDVHDGNLLWHGGRYLLYGMGYGNCTEKKGWIPPWDCPGIYQRMGIGCGFALDHRLNVYSSADLVSWRFEGDALPQSVRPPGIYFRPKVVFNGATGEFVLWINYLAQNTSRQTPLAAYPNATYLVAASKSALGPFAVVTPAAHTAVSGGGDFTLLAAPSGAAYIAHNGWGNSHRLLVEALTPSYHDARPETATAPLSAKGMEAPLLWEREGWYYLAFGSTCCFCTEGAGARVLVSAHPLGQWNDTGVDLNPKRHAWSSDHVIRSQNNFVAPVKTTRGVEFLFTADLWGSAADGLKSHDRQYWAPLAFDDSATPPTVAPLAWIDSFSIDLPPPREAGSAAARAEVGAREI